MCGAFVFNLHKTNFTYYFEQSMLFSLAHYNILKVYIFVNFVVNVYQGDENRSYCKVLFLSVFDKCLKGTTIPKHIMLRKIFK